MYIQYEWGNQKAESNSKKHGIAFEACYSFEWEEAIIVIDARRDYGEERRRAIGFIDGVLHALIYTRRGKTARVISLRKANQRERRLYEEAKDATET